MSPVENPVQRVTMTARTLARALFVEALIRDDVLSADRAGRLFDDLVEQETFDDLVQRAERILACVPERSAGQIEEDEEWAGQRGKILDLLRGLANNGRPWNFAPTLDVLNNWRQRATNVLGMIDT